MNEKKFDAKGSIYVKGRPAYPEQIFEYLIKINVIKENTIVADIGSGTGIFTLQMSPFVNEVFAVEPNDDMRGKAELLYKDFSNIVSVNGTAEATTLENASVDLITVAQAFHWFDRESFKLECQRILKEDGKVFLVWNDRDTSSEIIKENFEVNKKFCPNFKGSSNGIDFSKDGFKDFFEGDFELVKFENHLVYDKDAFISRNLSSSYAPKATDDCYDEYVNAISEVFDKHSKNEMVNYPYITRCYIGKVNLSCTNI